MYTYHALPTRVRASPHTAHTDPNSRKYTRTARRNPITRYRTDAVYREGRAEKSVGRIRVHSHNSRPHCTPAISKYSYTAAQIYTVNSAIDSAAECAIGATTQWGSLTYSTILSRGTEHSAGSCVFACVLVRPRGELKHMQGQRRMRRVYNCSGSRPLLTVRTRIVNCESTLLPPEPPSRASFVLFLYGFWLSDQKKTPRAPCLRKQSIIIRLR